MNAAYLLTPKSKLVWMQDDHTLRQALEKMRRYGYGEMPVVNRDGKYMGTVTEGDFLWHLIGDPQQELTTIPLQAAEEHLLGEIVTPDRVPAVSITASLGELMHQALSHSFIPVVDDTGTFIGIVTRTAVMRYCFAKHK